MDSSEGCWHLPPHGAECEYLGDLCYITACASDLLPDLYRQDFYNTGQRKEVVQAADFLIKEGRKQQRKRINDKEIMQTLSPDKPRLISNEEEKSRQLGLTEWRSG
jgi:hypothetical protein